MEEVPDVVVGVGSLPVGAGAVVDRRGVVAVMMWEQLAARLP